MGLLIRALIVAGNAALGWALGDVFNEVQTTYQQKQDASIAEAAGAAKTVAKRKWGWWVVGLIVLAVLTWLVLNLIKIIRND